MKYITTHSGRQLDPLAPRIEDIHIWDIAHSLAHLCRFAGHTHQFYSVAEHSVRVSFLVDERAGLHALLHDATEAYLVDVPTPLKALLPQYREIEKRLNATICAAFDIEPDTYKEEVKKADLEMCAAEVRDLMPIGDYGLIGVRPDPNFIVPWTVVNARELFLTRFNHLRRDE
jgi:hypothetical protein